MPRKIVHFVSIDSVFKKETLLILILLLSIFLRVYGLNGGLPNMYHSDENLIFDIAMHIGQNFITKRSLMPTSYYHEGADFTYPTFYIYLLVFLFGILYLFRTFDVTPAEIVARSLQPNETILLYIVGRLVTVIMSVATVYIVYLIGKKLYSEKVGLLSALFLSLTTMHARNSHWFTVDVPLTFWVVLSFYYVTYILEKDDLKYYLYAGITVGLATGTKYNGFLMFFIIIIAHLLRNNAFYGIKVFFKNIFDKKIILSFLTILGTFIATSPYIIIAFEDFKWWMNYHRTVNYGLPYGFGGFWPNTPVGWIYHIKISLLYGMGLPLETLSLTGVIYSLIKWKKGDVLLLSWTLLYYLIIGSWTTKFIRYVIPILPFLAIFGARLVMDIFIQMEKNNFVRFIVVGVALFISIYSFFYSLLYINVFAQEDVRTTANNWIDENIEGGSTIVVFKGWGHWTNPNPNKSKYILYEPLIGGFIDYVMTNSNESDYLIISSLNYRYFIKNRDVYPEYSKFFESLINGEKRYILIKKFEKQPNLLGYELNDSYPPRGILETHPTISIFKKKGGIA